MLSTEKQEQFVDWIAQKAVRTMSETADIVLEDKMDENTARRMAAQEGKMSMLKEALIEFSRLSRE